ncbi:hypothetical protein D9M70_503140 [compost metagenome]
MPPVAAAFSASAASTRRIGTAVPNPALTTLGPNVEQVSSTASASAASAERTAAVCCVMSSVRPPASSAARSRSARTVWRKFAEDNPSSRAAFSKTATLLSAVCRQEMINWRPLNDERLTARF